MVNLISLVFDRLSTHGWDAHVDRMVEHLDRWLLLFGEVLDDTFPEHGATDILWRAQRARYVLEPIEPPDADPRLPVLTTTRAT